VATYASDGAPVYPCLISPFGPSFCDFILPPGEEGCTTITITQIPCTSPFTLGEIGFGGVYSTPACTISPCESSCSQEIISDGFLGAGSITVCSGPACTAPSCDSNC
jgi:hypothetical protein